MRLFVALSTSREVRVNLTSLLNELRQLDSKPRWVNPAALHVTLKFIGNVPDQNLAPIDRALAGIVRPAQIRLEFRGLGFFPNDRHPAVVWVGIVAPPELSDFATRIDASLETCGIPRETRPFTPHLTIARLKEARLSKALRAQTGRVRDRSFGEQTVAEFQLMESKLKSSGAEYTTLRSYPFAPQGIAQ